MASDDLLAVHALAHYIDAGGRLEFRDSGAARPGSARPFVLSFTVHEPERYEAIWRRLMVQAVGRPGRPSQN